MELLYGIYSLSHSFGQKTLIKRTRDHNITFKVIGSILGISANAAKKAHKRISSISRIPDYEAIMSVGKPVGFFFHSSDAEKAKHGPIFEKIAKAHQKDLIFVYLDATKFSGFADVLALKQEWPAFGIQNPAKNEKFPFDQTKPFTDDQV